MAASFYFYDLETSGVSPRTARIMQFAGQRTDLRLKPLGEPDNFLVKLTEDILPEPDAVLITGITPQQTLAEGLSEPQFLRFFSRRVALADTIFVGFNNIRFDDEFMRFCLYRNFYDAYQWHWQGSRSRWDLLDVVRLTRALRPEGIEWPFDSAGKPSNRLEFLTAVNKLDHSGAHDALSDVRAAIAVARLIKRRQPRLFDYLLNLRSKQKVAALVGDGQPFVYASGRYPSEHHKTTVAAAVAPAPRRQGAIVFDLRHDPAELAGATAAELAARWGQWGKDAPYFPVKILQYNRCPAVAPLNVLDAASQDRLGLDMGVIKKHHRAVIASGDLSDRLVAAAELLQPKEQTSLSVDEQAVDGLLYAGFIGDADKTKMDVVRAADANQLANLRLDFDDPRLSKLLILYKARHFPASLTSEERKRWQGFKAQKLLAGGNASAAARYFKRLNELAAAPRLTKNQQYLLEELRLYGETVLPGDSA